MAATPTTPKGRRTFEHILDGARTVFARDGYVNTTMSAVKDEANISLGGLYRYFTDKEDLFEAVVGDIHDQLYRASGQTAHDFATEPYEVLFDANRGYLEKYYANRDVMRALIEAAGVESRFRDVWWSMRNRHVERFVTALRLVHGIEEVDGVSARVATEAAAALVEQSAYVWYAQEALRGNTVSLDDAAKIVTHAWHNLFFAGCSPSREPAFD